MNRDRRVKKIGAGGWGFVVDVPGPDGRRKQVRRQGFATSKDANDALHDLLDAAAQGLPTRRRGGLTVGAYLTDRWLPSLPGQGLRPTTVDSYRRDVRNHLVPHLGAVKLAALDGAAVETMMSALVAAGLSPKKRRNVLGVLSSALADAVRWKQLPRNPVADAKWPTSTTPTPQAWTAEQLATFLRHVAGDRLEPLWRFFAVTGCRRGEAAGLRWSDVDLSRGVAVITNQRTLAGGHVVEGPVKTQSGARTVALDEDTVALLRSWRRTQTAELVRLGVRPAVGYVFTGPDGTPWWPQTITSTFRRLCDELELPRIRVHGLRHSLATWMMAAGINPKVVSQRLGHSHVSITLGLYAHVLPGHDQAAADAFAAALVAQRGSECDIDVTPGASAAVKPLVR